MDISNNQSTQAGIKPISTAVKIFCCIVLLACSVALPALTCYIGIEGVNPAIPTAISVAVMALCLAFTLTLCKKPLFMGCAAAGVLLLVLVSPWFSVMFAALLCGIVACAALTADAVKGIAYLPVGIVSLASFGIAYALTRDPLLAAYALLPVVAGLALGNSYNKKHSIIISIGVATGALLTCYVVLIGAGALIAGMPPSMQGVTDLIKSYHAAVSGIFAESLQLMADTPELAAQLAPMLGGEITPELITEFSDSVATAVIGMLPGVSIMLAWFLCFTANRGMTALLMRGVDKKDYPVHLTAYQPSVPTAIFTILCYAALMIASFIPQGEIVVFIALNLLLALLPMMLVCGILSIISNVKHAPVKWPMLLTYGLAIIFLGVTVVPMVAFFGSFAVITQAIARALEKKFTDFKGGQ